MSCNRNAGNMSVLPQQCVRGGSVCVSGRPYASTDHLKGMKDAFSEKLEEQVTGLGVASVSVVRLMFLTRFLVRAQPFYLL